MEITDLQTGLMSDVSGAEACDLILDGRAVLASDNAMVDECLSGLRVGRTEAGNGHAGSNPASSTAKYDVGAALFNALKPADPLEQIINLTRVEREYSAAVQCGMACQCQHGEKDD